MKILVFLLFLYLIISCNHNHSNDDQVVPQAQEVLSEEEQLQRLYRDSVVPLFKDYKGVDIPEQLIIDEDDLTIDAGAATNYVEVSKGLVASNEVPIQIFVLAHEVSHLVTLAQARELNLQGEIPEGSHTNEYKKAEYLADLIAIHLISAKLPAYFELLKTDKMRLQDLLGSETFTHPSGSDRLASVKLYFQDDIEQDIRVTFKNRFSAIWNMR